MADKTLTERLQPSLLDRLTDHEPGQLKETRDARVIDISRLREIIQRDLSWLLNTNNMETEIDRSVYPRVADSVINYGLSEVAGNYSTAQRAEQIRKSIERAIAVHEPRIIKGTVDVSIVPDEDAPETMVAMTIRADMWAQPLPMELYLRSQVDITTGEIKVERSG